ncbi:hypothetical protein Poli38472_005012 [Pythium oligandrum]|uniref:Myb/SANT-like domain-containing protein n=1 Tax=Pythium oligandrum TaxID=41045 RepID=A0A8K1CBH5_PYTOL|nr:hypothetical protein Poli38472_005012 [Pythium oligandrum]|eukprot:TMW59943.1 hypothetical protein Poli38472_005012 [Pythium oligandrum]
MRRPAATTAMPTHIPAIAPASSMPTAPSTTPTNAAAAASNGKRTRMTRYNWDDPNKTHCLIALLTDMMTKKIQQAAAGERRYISGADWMLIFQQYNELHTSQPVANVLTLKNRLALLKIQYKDYQKVFEARKQALDGKPSGASWPQLPEKHPDAHKWKHVEFEFYDALRRFFCMTGEEGEHSLSMKADMLSQSADTAAVIAPSPVVPPPVAHMQHEMAVQALAAAANQIELQSELGKRRIEWDAVHPPHPRQRMAPSPSIPPIPLMPMPPKPIQETMYSLAVRGLAVLQLAVADRVDAKLFLLDERHQIAFLHMDPEEQREFLQRYCFSRRDHNGRWAIE